MTTNVIAISYGPRIDTRAIDRADLSPLTIQKYRRELERLELAEVSPLDDAALIAYPATLKHPSRAFLKAALRLTTAGLEQDIKSRVTPETIGKAQPYQYKKKGSDTGIDGLIFFQDDASGAKKIIVSVKCHTAS